MNHTYAPIFSSTVWIFNLESGRVRGEWWVQVLPRSCSDWTRAVDISRPSQNSYNIFLDKSLTIPTIERQFESSQERHSSEKNNSHESAYLIHGQWAQKCFSSRTAWHTSVCGHRCDDIWAKGHLYHSRENEPSFGLQVKWGDRTRFVHWISINYDIPSSWCIGNRFPFQEWIFLRGWFDKLKISILYFTCYV